MANPSIKRLAGPLALTTTLTTNLFNASDAAIYTIIYQIHVANTTGAPVNFSMWLGATGANAAGTQLFSAYNVAANSVFDWNTRLKMLSTDFLVGGAVATGLTVTILGEQYVV